MWSVFLCVCLFFNLCKLSQLCIDTLWLKTFAFIGLNTKAEGQNTPTLCRVVGTRFVDVWRITHLCSVHLIYFSPFTTGKREDEASLYSLSLHTGNIWTCTGLLLSDVRHKLLWEHFGYFLTAFIKRSTLVELLHIWMIWCHKYPLKITQQFISSL